MAQKAQHRPVSRNDIIIAGPAYKAAACPVITKIPVPMIQPIPRLIRLVADSERFSSAFSHSCWICDTGFLTKILDFTVSPNCYGYSNFFYRLWRSTPLSGNYKLDRVNTGTWRTHEAILRVFRCRCCTAKQVGLFQKQPCVTLDIWWGSAQSQIETVCNFLTFVC